MIFAAAFKIIIIPAYNKEKNLEGVLRSIREEAPDFDVVVINDGSTDRTSETARKFDFVKVIDLLENIGIGGAVQTGFLYSSGLPYQLAVQVDGDGQHKPAEIRKIVEPILCGEADVVIGSRFVEKARFRGSLFRRAGIKTFQMINTALLGERITDSTSGFRAYNRPAIEILSRVYPDDYPEPEAIYILKKKGLRIKEVPVEMETRAAGRSSITFWHSLYYMVKVCLAIFVLLLRKDD
ncbi:MAG: glycosyltransferase family 2 protein [Candidatus Aminicenantes bacterium]|nr:glycosyltransferase family 2 protein [Candidatus Aminicenantes bacterium]